MVSKDSNLNEIALDRVFNQLPVNVYWFDRNNTIMGCNTNQARMFGVPSPTEAVGRNLFEFSSFEESALVAHNNAEIVSTGQTKVFEEAITNEQGDKKVYLSHKSPLYNDEQQIIGVVGVSQDITRLKKDEAQILRQVMRSQQKNQASLDEIKQISQVITGNTKELKAESHSDLVIGIQNYFENIIAIMPGHVYWQDCNGLMLGCNDNQAATLGLHSRKEILGRHFHDFLSEKDQKLHQSIFDQVIAGGKSVVVEEKSSDATGQEKYYYSQKKPIKDIQGEVVGLLGYSLDITKRKEAELALIESRKKAEIANKAKSEFLMNMSHDLRTPCSGILGFAKILYDQEENPKKREQIKYILSSSEHLLNLLSEILDYTKVDDGAYSSSYKVFNLKTLIQGVLELLASETQRKQLTTRLIYPDHLASCIETDPLALHRILLNLCSNAVKFTEQGYIEVEVCFPEGNESLELTVRDSGIGIPTEDLQTIFERFTRLSPSFDGLHRGSGLGLSTVEKLLSNLLGHISVSSELGKGSEFVVTLPVRVDSNNQEDRINKVVRFVKGYRPLHFLANPGLRVLVIEDDFISQQVSKSLFESFSAEVTLVDCGRQALCEDLSQFDFILTDIGLPDINGFELVSEIRAWERSHGVTCSCRIVGLTAHIGDAYLNKLDASELSGLLQKPLTREIIDKL